MRKRLKLLVCLVIATIVCSGFVTTILEDFANVIEATGWVMLSAEVRFAAFNGASCTPEYMSQYLTLSKDTFVAMSNFIIDKKTAALTERVAVTCAAANLACLAFRQEWGGPCDLSYPPPEPEGLPVRIDLVGYVVYVHLTLNNQLPLAIKTVQAEKEGVGKGVQTSFRSTACDAHCAFSGFIRLSGFDISTKSINFTLVVTAEMPIAWGFPQQWFTLGATERTMRVPLEVLPSSGLVRLSTEP